MNWYAVATVVWLAGIAPATILDGYFRRSHGLVARPWNGTVWPFFLLILLVVYLGLVPGFLLEWLSDLGAKAYEARTRKR